MLTLRFPFLSDIDTRVLCRLPDVANLEDLALPWKQALIQTRLEHLLVEDAEPGSLDSETAQALDYLIAECRVESCERNAEVFPAETSGDRMGVLLQGRLETRTRSIDPGMAFGEEALLGRDRHERVFRCVRDAEFLVLTRKAFDQGVARFPQAFLGLLRRLGRLHVSSRRAVYSVLPGNESFLDAVYSVGGSRVVTSHEAEALFGFPAHQDLLRLWMSSLESRHGRLLLIGDARVPLWNQFCLEHSDGNLSLDVVDPCWIRPRGEAWATTPLPALPGRLRVDHQPDFLRLARLIAGQGRGLVLSGGGARGFAHIGVLKALTKMDLVPDSLGGTSMGALVAALYALHRDVGVLEDLASHLGRTSKVLDWGLGTTSLTAGYKIAKLLTSLFGSTAIEDLTSPFFCVSTDLTSAREVVFTSGLVKDAVRASLAIPGVFYPVVRGGEILVDGGLMNNLPLDLLARRMPGGALMACDVTAGDWQAAAGWVGSPDAARNAWNQWWDQLLPSKRGKVPALADLLLQTLEVNSRRHFREAVQVPHSLLSIDVTGFDPLDFGAWKRLIAEGYDQACRYIDSMLY